MPKTAHGYIIGFDFGLKRIGVAIGQTVTQSASPEAIVNSRDGVPDWEHIAILFETWQPQAIVVGLPMRLDGQEQPMTQSARKFGQRLSGRFHRPVYFIEEQLSSIEAEKRFSHPIKNPTKSPNKNHAAKNRTSKSPHRRIISDDHAAQIILQNWLENYWQED